MTRAPRTLKMTKARAFLRTVAELLPRADATVWLQRASCVLVLTVSGSSPRRGSVAALAVWEPMPTKKRGTRSLRARVAWVGTWPEYTTGVTDGLRQLYPELVMSSELSYDGSVLSFEPAASFSNIPGWEVGLFVRGGMEDGVEDTTSPVWATIQEWAVSRADG